MLKRLCLSLALISLAAVAHAAELPTGLVPSQEAGMLCAVQADPAGLPEPHWTDSPDLQCTAPLCRTVEDCFGFPCGPYTFCMGATPYSCGSCQCY